MNVDKIEAGFRLVLEGLGLDPNSPRLKDTPRRTALAWTEELCAGLGDEPLEFELFPVEEGYRAGLISLDRIPVKSLCAHHLLPFVGLAVVAYVPNGVFCGLSKLSRAVNHFARRPQMQEHLTHQVAEFLDKRLQPAGLGVAIQATHYCMEFRGVNHSGLMTTSSLQGSLRDDPVLREEFFRLWQAPGARAG
jgi:GTP cyclohydrolase I